VLRERARERGYKKRFSVFFFESRAHPFKDYLINIRTLCSSLQN
jgi:hypothetical protein